MAQCNKWADDEQNFESEPLAEKEPWQVISRYPEYREVAEKGRMAAEGLSEGSE